MTGMGEGFNQAGTITEVTPQISMPGGVDASNSVEAKNPVEILDWDPNKLLDSLNEMYPDIQLDTDEDGNKFIKPTTNEKGEEVISVINPNYSAEDKDPNSKNSKQILVDTKANLGVLDIDWGKNWNLFQLTAEIKKQTATEADQNGNCPSCGTNVKGLSSCSNCRQKISQPNNSVQYLKVA